MSEMVFCRACGKQIHKTAPTCPSCGAPQIAVGKNTKSKTTAVVLALFVGAFGVHRFYLNRWWGLPYLLLCWTGITGVVALIEGIVFAFTKQEKWDAKYNGGQPTGDAGAGSAVIAIVAVISGIALIGILAAIALPAYHDYTVRARVQEAVMALEQATPLVGEYIETRKEVPDSLEAAGFNRTLPASIESVAINKRTGEILVTMAGSPAVAGKSFSMVPAIDDARRVTWQCQGNTLPDKNMPPRCRH